MSITVILDPGHGIQRRWLDKGVVFNKTVFEADIVLDYALTCKHILVNHYNVVMTRDKEIGPELFERTKIKGDIFISLHLNSINTYGMVYYKSQGFPTYVKNSKTISSMIQKTMNLKFLKPSYESRFGRLYIDDFPKTALLIEIDAINKVKNTREARLDFANKLLQVLKTFYKV